MDTAAQRLRLALDVYEVGEQLQRQRVKRMDPNASDAEIDAKLQAWRLLRPGAPNGDCPGQLSRRFE